MASISSVVDLLSKFQASRSILFGRCVRCRNDFYTHLWGTRFCSWSCAQQNRFYGSNQIPEFKCDSCHKTFKRIPSRKTQHMKHKFCNRLCFNRFFEKNRKTLYHGTFYRGVYMRRHRAIMEKHIGKPLRSDEIVHHINHNPQDDRLENLKIMTRVEHRNHHILHGGSKFPKLLG